MKLSDRERRLLGYLALLAAIGAGVWAYRWATGAGAAVGYSVESLDPKPRPGKRVVRLDPRTLPSEVWLLELERLEISPRDFTVGRDPFRFGPLPPPPPPPGPSPEELERRRREEEERRKRLAEEVAERARPRPPEVPFRYLGNFGPRAARIAVLFDPRFEAIVNVREGDVLEGKFRVGRIGYESVDIEFVDFPGEPARRLAIGG